MAVPAAQAAYAEMIDPATAIKEVGEKFTELYGTRVRLVGHQHWFNPENAPTTSEAKALDAFARGAKEFSEVIEGKDGKPYLQVMRPMHVVSGCIRCQ